MAKWGGKGDRWVTGVSGFSEGCFGLNPLRVHGYKINHPAPPPQWASPLLTDDVYGGCLRCPTGPAFMQAHVSGRPVIWVYRGHEASRKERGARIDRRFPLP